MTGRPAEALLKDTRGSREGTRRISRVVPRQTRQTCRSPSESGFRVLLTSVCKLHAEILEVFAARRPAVSGSTVRTPAKPALFGLDQVCTISRLTEQSIVLCRLPYIDKR